MNAVVSVLRSVHASDMYPTFWPHDPHAWVANHREREAWVATEGSVIVGHGALHTAVDDLAAPVWCEGTGKDPEQLGVIARLFTDACVRGRGTGGRLLDAVTERAYELELTPVMDVAVERTDLIAYYHRRGWRDIGETQVWMPNGIPFTVLALVHENP